MFKPFNGKRSPVKKLIHSVFFAIACFGLVSHLSSVHYDTTLPVLQLGAQQCTVLTQLTTGA